MFLQMWSHTKLVLKRDDVLFRATDKNVSLWRYLSKQRKKDL